MSAADLFKDCHDVDFRLRGTHIMIGKEPYHVMAVEPGGSNLAEDTLLHLMDATGGMLRVSVGKLPLRTMFACPSGYYEGTWVTRGPARSRFQGITESSLWAVMSNGRLISDAGYNPKNVLKTLAAQPRTRRPGKRPSGMITRDIFVTSDNQLLIKGREMGKYLGENKVELIPGLEKNPFIGMFLNNAKLSLKDAPQLEMEMPFDMCAGRPD